MLRPFFRVAKWADGLHLPCYLPSQSLCLWPWPPFATICHRRPSACWNFCGTNCIERDLRIQINLKVIEFSSTFLNLHSFENSCFLRI